MRDLDPKEAPPALGSPIRHPTPAPSPKPAPGARPGVLVDPDGKFRTEDPAPKESP